MSAPTPAFTVPEGFTLHKENSAAILLPATNDAFLNPVQEFNRDLSVACIRAWGERANADRERRWRAAAARLAAKRAKGESGPPRRARPSVLVIFMDANRCGGQSRTRRR